MRVNAQDNSEWVVQRHWAPRIGNETVWGRFSRRFRSASRRAADLGDADPVGCLDVGLEGLAVGVFVLVAIAFAALVGIPFLLALLDLLVVLLLAVLGVAGRVFLRRPWTVSARLASGEGPGREWRVAGWKASGRVINEVATRLSEGEELPPPGPIASI